MKLISGLVAFSLFIKGAAGQCSLCPGGYSAIENPTYKIHSLAPSCEEVDAGLAGVEDKDCDNELALVNFEFDFSTACCSDISLQSIACSICPEDLYLHPDVLLPNTTIPITCGEVEIISSFVSDGDSFTCKQIKARKSRMLWRQNRGVHTLSCRILHGSRSKYYPWLVEIMQGL